MSLPAARRYVFLHISYVLRSAMLPAFGWSPSLIHANHAHKPQIAKKEGGMEMYRIARTLYALILPGLFAWVVIGGSPVLAQSQAQGARADLKDAQGQSIGTA